MHTLEKKLGYTFKQPRLLENALYHSSYANEHRALGMGSNERLEFLGDAVLGVVTAEYLFRRHPDLPEGDLTRLRAALVCEESGPLFWPMPPSRCLPRCFLTVVWRRPRR